MLTVESILRGILLLVNQGIITNSWRCDFIINVMRHVDGGSTLSTVQCEIILKIASNNMWAMQNQLGVSKQVMKSAISNPQYEKTPYVSISIKREVRYLGIDKLAFRFKLDPLVVEEIKALRSKHSLVNCAPRWNPQYRVWIVTVTPDNLNSIMQIISNHKFNHDTPVLEYLTLCHNSDGVKSSMTLASQEKIVVANICNNPLLSYVGQQVWNGQPT